MFSNVQLIENLYKFGSIFRWANVRSKSSPKRYSWWSRRRHSMLHMWRHDVVIRLSRVVVSCRHRWSTLLCHLGLPADRFPKSPLRKPDCQLPVARLTTQFVISSTHTRLAARSAGSLDCNQQLSVGQSVKVWYVAWASLSSKTSCVWHLRGARALRRISGRCAGCRLHGLETIDVVSTFCWAAAAGSRCLEDSPAGSLASEHRSSVHGQRRRHRSLVPSLAVWCRYSARYYLLAEWHTGIASRIPSLPSISQSVGPSVAAFSCHSISTSSSSSSSICSTSWPIDCYRATVANKTMLGRRRGDGDGDSGRVGVSLVALARRIKDR